MSYTKLENRIFEDDKCNMYHIAVYASIAHHADSKGDSFPSFARISKETGMSRAKVALIIPELIEYGYIKKEQRKTVKGGLTSNLYTIVEQEKKNAPSTANTESTKPVEQAKESKTNGNMHKARKQASNNKFINCEQRDYTPDQLTLIAQGIDPFKE